MSGASLLLRTVSRSTRCPHRSWRRAAPPFWVDVQSAQVQPSMGPIIVIIIITSISVIIIVVIIVIIVTTIIIITIIIIIPVVVITIIVINTSVSDNIVIGRRGKGREGIGDLSLQSQTHGL